MPKGNMEHVRLPVLDKEATIKQEINRVEYTLKLEVTERLLLGAQYRLLSNNVFVLHATTRMIPAARR